MTVSRAPGRGVVAAAIAAALAVFPLGASVAHAHPVIDEARHAYEEAEFVGALDACARAEARDDLTTGDLAEMYAVRALVYLAMGNADAMRADLARLVSIAPDHALDRRAPPDVQTALLEARTASPGPIRLSASPEPSPAGVTVRAEVSRDPSDLVREVRVVGRIRGTARWQRASDAPLFIAADAASVIEYYAEAIGPGGAVLARNGTEAEPLSAGGHGVTTEGAETSEDGGEGTSPWLFVGIGAGVLILGAAIVIIAVGASSGQPDTQPSPFRVEL